MASSRSSRREKQDLEKLPTSEEINPHIPSYISSAPWYIQGDKRNLDHQRYKSPDSFDGIDSWYDRGKKVAVATKFRKGACTNCGAMTHKAKDCCERPRKIGARWSGQDIQPDESVKDVHLSFEGKRDRWNGYDPENHTKLMEQYAKVEQERQRRKKEEEKEVKDSALGKEKPEKGGESESEDSEHEDEDKKDFLDTTEAPVGVKKDPRTRTTVRNLRIREDTAKYLKDLSVDGPHYDPKSRSMRAAAGSKHFQETTEAFVRQSQQVHNFREMQDFSFTAYEKGQAIHMQALPSQAELVFKKYQEKKELLNTQNKSSIFDKYGDQNSYQKSDPALLLGQTEHFVEYAHDGTLIDKSIGKTKTIPVSKYEEDVLINNHTAVWGSFWEDGLWGYACCHQTVKRSYCTGEAGIRARNEMKEDQANREKAFAKSAEQQQQQQQQHQHQQQNDSSSKSSSGSSSSSSSSSSSLKGFSTHSGSKRSLGYAEMSQEEYETYLSKRSRHDDPMRDFLQKNKEDS